MIHLANDPNLDKWDDKLQSEVITYNLSKPMTMIGFVSLPDHAQKEYLQILKKNGGSTAQIAEMLGCSTETVLELMKRNGIRAGGRRTDDAAFLWAEFIKDYEMPPMETPTASIKAPAPPETPQKAPETPKAEDVPEPPPALEAAEPPGTEPAVTFTADIPVMSALRAFRVDLAGPMDGVLAKLKTFTDLIGNMPVRVTISVDEEE